MNWKNLKKGLVATAMAVIMMLYCHVEAAKAGEPELFRPICDKIDQPCSVCLTEENNEAYVLLDSSIKEVVLQVSAGDGLPNSDCNTVLPYDEPDFKIDLEGDDYADWSVLPTSDVSNGQLLGQLIVNSPKGWSSEELMKVEYQCYAKTHMGKPCPTYGLWIVRSPNLN